MSDVTFLEVEFLNYMSFGNIITRVPLKQKGTTLVIGENLDSGGSSGSGKTTLINAVSYAAYDKIPSAVSKDRLINQTNDKKNTSMMVSFSFERDGKVYKATRKRGATSALQLLEDGKDITPASSSAFNAKLEELIGFSYNLFSQIILFNGNSRPFLDFSVGEQRALIEELFRITTLSQKAGTLKKIAGQTDKDIAVQKALIKQQEEHAASQQRHLDATRARVEQWDSTRAQQLERISEQIEKLSAIDFETEEALHAGIETLKEQMAPIQGSIQALNAELQSVTQRRFPKATDKAMAKSKLTQLTQDLNKLAKEIEHLEAAKCPYCLQEYREAATKIDALIIQQDSGSKDHRILEEQIKQLTAEEEEFALESEQLARELRAKIGERQSDLQKFAQELNDYRAGVLYNSIKDMATAQGEMTSIQAKLEAMLLETNPHLEMYDQLKAESVITVDTKALDELITLQEHQAFLVKLLTDKNSFIRKNIISKTIPFLNKRIGYYTDKLNLPHIVLFQPDMSCEISEHGRTLDHGNLSNGEKKKLNLSLCFAFRDVLTYLHSKVNVLFTDEIDGGSLSGPDIDSLISLLKAKAWDDEIGIFIISHRPEFDGRCDRNLVVRKERGFSTLIDQPEE